MKLLSQLLRRVGTAHKAGLSMVAVWGREAKRGGPTQQLQITRVSEHLAAGDSLADALAAGGDYFPPLIRDLVDIGERTGRLDDVLLTLADHYDYLLTLRRSFLMGILWPAIQLVAAIMVIGILIGVLGAIGGTGLDGKPIDVLGFGVTGKWGVILYFWLVGAAFVTIGLPIFAILRGWLGPAPMRVAMQVPVIGGVLRTAALARLAWTLSMSLDAGVDAMRAIRLSLRSTDNIYYTSRGHLAEQAIREGKEFHEALRAMGVFPDDFLHTLETAELAGTPGEGLQRLANDYRERTKSSAKILTAVATFGTWALVASILLVLIFRGFTVLYLNPLKQLTEFKF